MFVFKVRPNLVLLMTIGSSHKPLVKHASLGIDFKVQCFLPWQLYDQSQLYHHRAQLTLDEKKNGTIN